MKKKIKNNRLLFVGGILFLMIFFGYLVPIFNQEIDNNFFNNKMPPEKLSIGSLDLWVACRETATLGGDWIGCGFLGANYSWIQNNIQTVNLQQTESNWNLYFGSSYEDFLSKVDDTELPLRFIVISDIHVGGNNVSRPVAAFVTMWKPDFLLLSGDMTFDVNENRTDLNILWYEILAQVRNASIPIYPTVGNHENIEESAIWREFLWANDMSDDSWYSFTVKDTKFVVIENNFDHNWNCRGYDPYGLVNKQLSFANSELESAKTERLFLVSHKGAYWNTTAYPDTMFSIYDDDYRCNQKIFDEWLDKYQIDMFISGHQHFGDFYNVNGTIYGHIPPAYLEKTIPNPGIEGEMVIFDIETSSIRVRIVNYNNTIVFDKMFMND